MLKATWKYYRIFFRKPATTSRGVLLYKDSWLIFIFDDKNPETCGIGECSIIPGLSPDPFDKIENELNAVCESINLHEYWMEYRSRLFPAIKFGLQTALNDFMAGGKRVFHENDFLAGERGLPINGLIWMGSKSEMKKQIIEKVEQGFDCLKLKVGAIDFDQEVDLIRYIREEFKNENLEIRLDANGAFKTEEALQKLKTLSDFNIHSIEQPIKQGQIAQMAELCKTSPIPVALDEELIGVVANNKKKEILELIAPSYLILKPSLLGGLGEAEDWIYLAKELKMGWWVTSALESNVGLNAIAQWISNKNPSTIQGLGTGQLYTNNFQSPLTVSNGKLFHFPEIEWEINV